LKIDLQKKHNLLNTSLLGLG